MESVIDNFETQTIRQDFPALARKIDSRPMVYLDSAATSLKPNQVIGTLVDFYATSAGSINRAVYRPAREASNRYNEARRSVAALIGAEEDEVVFVRNTTEAINIVANWYATVRDGRVVITLANHHSNYLPWLKHHTVTCAGLNNDGTLSIEELQRVLRPGKSLLCVPHVSNPMGLLVPIEKSIAMAREVGSLVLVDGAQSVPYMPVDVKSLKCDFLTFSGHKMLAPFGIGVLYARRELLEKMPPLLFGGDMAEMVSGSDFALREAPARFEGGTPNVGGAIALASAVDYLEKIGLDRIYKYVKQLTAYARKKMRNIEGLEIYGPKSDDLVSSAVSFGFPGMAAHTLSLILSNRFGIMARSGYHCAQPFHEALGLPQTVRASFYLYNTKQEVEILVDALKQIRKHATQIKPATATSMGAGAQYTEIQ